MPRRCISFGWALLAVLAALLPSGCTPPADVGNALIASPGSLNFGAERNRLTIEVSKNYSTGDLDPVVATPSAPWIRVENCTDEAERCDVNGPFRKVRINISVDRNFCTFGTNRGQVILSAAGAALKTVDVTAEDLIQSSFTVDDRQPAIGQPVQFTDLSVADGAITSRLWDFGDGQTSTGINPVHQYTREGVFDVKLTVRTANSNETRVETGYIVVESTKPRVDFSADRTTVVVDESVSFTDLTVSPAAPIVSRRWDFGDNGVSTEINPKHQYRSIGLKTVTLTVTTEFGTTSVSKQNFIVVRNKLAPTAKIAISQVKPYVDVPVQFTDISEPGSAPILTRVWEFGDSNASTQTNPTHTYRGVGNFVAKLTVITDHGKSTTEFPLEVVFKPPTPDFVASDVNPDVNTDVQFTDTSLPGSGPIIAWAWNFGDGKTSTQQNPVHRYTAPRVYTVTLTVTMARPDNNVATLVKKDYISVVTPPTPVFSFSPQSVFINQQVQFTSNTINGSEPIQEYRWDLDGNPLTTTDVSLLQNPTFTYTTPGTYNVRLSVRTATRTRSFTAPVVVDRAPVASFNATPRTATTVDTIAFTDTSDPGQQGASKAIISRRWEFGDGQGSTAANPTHTYAAPGTYSVKLVLRYTHSGSGEQFLAETTRQNFITITNPVAPTAAFGLGQGCLFSGDTAQFTDQSINGTRPITAWQWSFGDGGTSTEQNPSHVYANSGRYMVTLTVTASALPAGLNTSSYSEEIYVAEQGALDDFVNTPDPNYQFNLVNTIPFRSNGVQFATAFNIYMVSQHWRSAAEIYTAEYDGRIWNHNLTVITPTTRSSRTAIMLVSGGNRNNAMPTEEDLLDSTAPQIAVATGAVVAIISNVPAQPIQFADEVTAEGARNRTEDEIIAYSFDQYLKSFENGTPDTTWPALFPMTKAVVRGMDTVQDFLAFRGVPIDDFIVTGGSKRGWTTWLTGVTDCRIRAIAPMVIDVLNIDESMRHHFAAYGFFAPTLEPYTEFNIFQRLATSDAASLSLLDLVDPFEYRERARMPKLIVNATGDEFFVPTSSQFYLDELSGETRLTYLPNTSHGLTEAPDIGDPSNVATVLVSWVLAILQDVPRPEVAWNFLGDNSIQVDLGPNVPLGTEVTLWQATNPTARDFRVLTIGATWTSTRLTSSGSGIFTGTVTTPTTGYRAYMVQVRIPSTAQPQVTIPGAASPAFVFSTPVRVVPDILPFETK